MPKGYASRVIDGKLYHEQLSTGELFDNITVNLVAGSIVYTPEQQEAYRKRKAAEAVAAQRQQEYELRKKLRRRAASSEGYYFIMSEQGFDSLAPATAAKLVYLISFLGYDSRLMLTQRTPMKRTDLASVLSISPATVTRFLDEVVPVYITVNDDKTLSVNDTLFFRGYLTDNRRGIPYQKFYIAGVRKLYRMTPTNQHKQLGYVYQMLPYINREYNILCKNPDEAKLDDIVCLTEDEFCGKIGYSGANVHRLMKLYKGIRFEVGNHMELFLSQANGMFFVNPNILYIGSSFERVEVLGFFCDDRKRKSRS